MLKYALAGIQLSLLIIVFNAPYEISDEDIQQFEKYNSPNKEFEKKESVIASYSTIKDSNIYIHNKKQKSSLADILCENNH